MLIELTEPGQTPEPHANDTALAVGIDLGTTNSLIAISQNQKPEIIADRHGHRLLPSVVTYHNGTVIRSVKRLMGKGINDIKKIAGLLPFDISLLEEDMQGIVRLNVEDRTVTPVEVSAEILKELKSRAEAALGKAVNRAVITVPAYFDDAARNATKDAAKLAGLEVLRLVNEPTAAALAYGLDKNAEGIYAVYDLGGGTFDMSLLRLEKGIFQVLATGGDTALGGDDFDAAVAEILLVQAQIKQPLPELSHEQLQSLLLIAKKIKEDLSTSETARYTWEIAGFTFEGSLSRSDFEQAIHMDIAKTMMIADNVITDAALTPMDIDGVIMVGGATRIPAIQRAVQLHFNKHPLTDVNPDEVVALGAALQAENLTGGTGSLLLDVLPLSLGIEMMGGLNEKVIHRNTPIPVAIAQEFTTYQDNQTGLKLHIVQGEREMADDCRSLARFELTGIPAMKAGAAHIRVEFRVDADGLLMVEAREETTGIHQQIEVKPSYGLQDGEIETMLRASMEHAQEDVARRLLTESRVESERTILAIEEAMKADGHLIDETAQAAILRQLSLAKETVAGSDRDLIAKVMQQLEQETNILVSAQMNAHVGKALSGLTIEQLEKF